jgi:hypothetical protein
MCYNDTTKGFYCWRAIIFVYREVIDVIYPKNLNSHKKSFNLCNHLFDREKQNFHLAEFLY